MEYLSHQNSSVACDKGLPSMKKNKQCTDRIGRLLASKVKVTWTLILPLDRDIHVSCLLNSDPSEPTELTKE